ncbi:metallophosphoesterase family protein [Flectobacillus rivi]|uniref:Metallophosphoesterase n=1 Tax=Flectobacillus rivi TaxID=2984209 RepID=A0ABT6Z9T2_9BACT|nr:metallophosphoesterase [Flectobacillus rivi]MDI9877346.1 metallophosphoesterase [Flectobacillus rivi]
MRIIRITKIEEDAIERISFLTIPQNSVEPSEYILPIYKGTVSGLPQNINAIVVTSDLQGVVNQGGENLLLGEVLADNLKLIFDIYFPTIEREKTIAFLCGDLYADLTKRGQSGNPINVWKKFASVFGWTIGIAGNHDNFDDNIEEIFSIKNTKILINEIFEIEGLQIGGLSGIIGRPDKNFRLQEAVYLKALSNLLNKKPTILLTHLSPKILEKEFQGDERVTETLENGNITTLFCGHSHWNTNQPYNLKNKTQILNADTKVFVLTKE